MHAFILMLIGGLVSSIPAILAKIGIGVVAYIGIDTLVNSVKDDALQKIGALDPFTVSLVGVLQIGTGINILCSAVITRFVLQGLTAAGGVKRITVK